MNILRQKLKNYISNIINRPLRSTAFTLMLTMVLTLAASVAVSAAEASGSVGAASSVSTAASASASKKKKSSSKKGKKKKKSSRSKKNKKGTRRSKKKRISKRWSNPQTPPPETPQNDSLTLLVNSRMLELIPKEQNPGGLRVNSVKTNGKQKRATVSLNDNFTYLPVTRELIDELQKVTRRSLPDSIQDYDVTLKVGNHALEYYINKIDPLPEKFRKNIPFVRATHPYSTSPKGMEGDILALWHSHGRYYKPKADGWMWQRPLLFQSIEDTYTMGYILPYAVPMLENAGAYVMLPRERDTNSAEVIVDNDTNDGGEIYSQAHYREMNGVNKWETGEFEGFIYDLPDFRDTENPFENGSYRQARTQRSGSPSVAAWYADIPADGEYAVYVSYKTLPESTTDAAYTVNYSGGTREFKVNQKMGGGTWIYLGTFPFEAGYSDTEPTVTLSNITGEAGGTIVTADAVKIGGGMGNIARSPKRSDIYYDPSVPENEKEDTSSEETAGDEEEEEDDEDQDQEDEEGLDVDGAEPSAPAPAAQPSGKAPIFRTSGLPRYLEGARYWLHWAGFPESVYSPYHGSDDYKDDYTSRGLWVNYLAGGSRVLPDDPGLGIPVDLALGLHSDAGKRSDDSFVGTLGIYYTAGGDKYNDGTARINSRMLTDLVMRQITGDIRNEWEPSWKRRSMWDKSYVEARVPEVPSTLIELLSHQNFADMQYGLDPRFQFTVGRAIYKGLARFMGERKKRDVVIQPLPVKDFAIVRTKKKHYRLSWKPTPDRLEPTAMPKKYIILERSGDELGFHKIGETASTHYDVKTNDNEIHSFRILAVNDGGVSFPSETLVFREGTVNDGKPVMIVNGFTRVSGPDHFSEEGKAGFRSDVDFGVPYIRSISYTGPQTEFNRSAGESFGRSSSGYIGKIVAGNTFDFPYVHGEAMLPSGRGFVSASVGAVEEGDVKLSDYKTVDLILGRQKATMVGRGEKGVEFSVFPEKLRRALTEFTAKGGRLIASGERIVSDVDDSRNDIKGGEWLRNTFGIEQDTISGTYSSRIESNPEAMRSALAQRSYGFNTDFNEHQYAVQHPDAISLLEGTKGEPVLHFSDSDATAGVLVNKGRSRLALMSVPFESLTDPNQRILLMTELLRWLEE